VLLLGTISKVKLIKPNKHSSTRSVTELLTPIANGYSILWLKTILSASDSLCLRRSCGFNGQ